MVKSMEKKGDKWVAQTVLGPTTFQFAPPNDLGVLDHDVEIAGGKFHNPMRVVPNGKGSDLNKLRTVLEHR